MEKVEDISLNKFEFIKEKKTKAMRESIEDDYQKQIDTMETKNFKLDKK